MASHAQNARAYRDMLIGNAVRARKIAPDRAEDYKRLFDADPRNVTHLLTAPVDQGGLMAGIAYDRDGQPVPAAPTDYPADWLPETRRGSAVRGEVAFEDQFAATEAVSATPPARRASFKPGPPPAGAHHGSVVIGHD